MSPAQLLQGKILYLQTWNNKPPLMLWTFALEVEALRHERDRLSTS